MEFLFFSYDSFGFSALWERRNFLGKCLSPMQSGEPWGYITSNLQVVHPGFCCLWYLVWGGGWLWEGVGPGPRVSQAGQCIATACKHRFCQLKRQELCFYQTTCSMLTRAHSSSHQMRHLCPLSRKRCCILLRVVFRGCLWSSLKHHRGSCGPLLQFLWGW